MKDLVVAVRPVLAAVILDRCQIKCDISVARQRQELVGADRVSRQIVDNVYRLFSALKKTFGQMAADEPESAGYERAHDTVPSCVVASTWTEFSKFSYRWMHSSIYVAHPPS